MLVLFAFHVHVFHNNRKEESRQKVKKIPEKVIKWEGKTNKSGEQSDEISNYVANGLNKETMEININQWDMNRWYQTHKNKCRFDHSL